MGQFRYRAMDNQGAAYNGQLEAATLELATQQLQARGLLIKHIEVAPLIVSTRRGLWSRRAALSARQLSQFTQQLATLLSASQPLEKALSILLRQPGNPAAGRLIERIRDRVKSGELLSAAMLEEGEQFPPFYLSLVRAGEAGGALAKTLAQLSEYLDRANTLRGEVTNALIYPSFLLVGVLGSLALLLAYVVPQFVPIFDGLGVPIPLITEVILAIGQFLSRFGLLILAGIIAAILGISAQLRRASVRLAWDRALLRVRVVGPLLQWLETARLARTLGTLLIQGVPLLSALGIAAGVCNNRAVAVAVQRSAEKIKDGGVLSQVVMAEHILPDLALQMIEVGEESGQLDGMLLKVADIFDQEAKRGIDRLLAALVPSLTLVMAALVALIMLAIMLPLMSLTSNI